MMNLRAFFMGVFTGNRSDEGLEAIRQAAKEDATALAEEYAKVFTQTVTDVLSSHLTIYRGDVTDDETEVIESSPVRRLGRPKRA